MGNIKNKILVGAHISTAGGLNKAIERAESIGCTTMQIFTKNNKSWFGKKITKEEEERFKEILKKSNLSKIMAHSSYLINLASSNEEVESKSVTALKHELHRCEQLEIPYLIFHPGSHTGQGEEKGIKQVTKNINKVLSSANGKTKLLLETMAGQGTSIAHTLEQIKTIIKNLENKKLVGICLDTCHMFAAGYDFSSEKAYTETINKWIKGVGIRKINAIHLNDSKTELGSKKDRHENLGLGYIPKKIFKLIMKDERLKHIPKVLETPDSSLYEKEIKYLKSK